METLGKYFPNTPMLAAVVKVSGIMSDEDFLKDIQEKETTFTEYTLTISMQEMLKKP